MSDKVSLGMLATGVPGLDTLLGGGLGEFSFNMIAGAPGSGKTTLAHQIMFALASPERKALFFTVLGEPPLKMLRYQQQYSFFKLDKVGESIRYVNLAEDLRTGNFRGVIARIMEEVEAFGPSLVFVDSFRSVVQTARAGNEGVAELQYFIQELGTRMASWQATSFLIGEYAHADVDANPILTVADGVLSLSQHHEQNSVVRKMRVVKMRGQAHLAGSHTFRISSDGVHIYPRLLPPLAEDRKPGYPLDHATRRIPSGVPTLDPLLHGGIPLGHSVLVAGPSGSGKTILATQFLAEGARQGEHGVAVYFEKGTSRLRNVRLAEMVQAGHVSVVESRALDLSIEELLDELLTTVERTGARRVVIDSLSEVSLYLAPEFRENLRLGVFRILSALAKLDVTVLLTMGVDDRFTELRFSQSEVAFLTDAIIALRYVELGARLEKVLSVVKVRGSAHSTELRLFHISDQGIQIDSVPLRAEGLLSGHPSPRNGY